MIKRHKSIIGGKKIMKRVLAVTQFEKDIKNIKYENAAVGPIKYCEIRKRIFQEANMNALNANIFFFFL